MHRLLSRDCLPTLVAAATAVLATLLLCAWPPA
jgi:hypothetical protein